MKTTTILQNIVEQLKQIKGAHNVSIKSYLSENENTICHKIVAWGMFYKENEHVYYYVVVTKKDKEINYDINYVYNYYEAKYMFAKLIN